MWHPGHQLFLTVIALLLVRTAIKPSNYPPLSLSFSEEISFFYSFISK